MEMNPVLLSLILVLGMNPTSAHKFEDGFVERTMAVVVRDQVATVEYSVGLNSKTLRGVLNRWELDSKNLEPKNGGTPQTSDKNPGSPFRTNLTPKPPTRNSSSNKNGNQSPSISNGSENRSGQSNPQTPKPAVVMAQETDSDSDSGHQIDAELFARFKQMAPDEIVNRIVVTCDGRRITPRSISKGPSPLHPFVLKIVFEFELPTGNNIDVKIRDQNFIAETGAVRYALKAKGSTMLLRSNKAPILVRSERFELSKSSPEERDELTTIASRLAVLEKKP